jgi:ankyrin repeat protein
MIDIISKRCGCVLQAGHASVIQYLLAHEADVNAVTERGATATFVASLFGHLDALEVMIWLMMA